MSRPDDNGSDTDDFLEWVATHPPREGAPTPGDLIERDALRRAVLGRMRGMPVDTGLAAALALIAEAAPVENVTAIAKRARLDLLQEMRGWVSPGVLDTFEKYER